MKDAIYATESETKSVLVNTVRVFGDVQLFDLSSLLSAQWENEPAHEIAVLAPQYFYTDRSKAVLLLWFLIVTCSCCPYLYFGSAIMLVTCILFAESAFRKLLSIYVFSYFPFGFEGRIWDLIVSVPDHCLSFYFYFR